MSNLRRIVEQNDNPEDNINVLTLDSFVEDVIEKAQGGELSWPEFFDGSHENTSVVPSGHADLAAAMKRVWDALQK